MTIIDWILQTFTELRPNQYISTSMMDKISLRTQTLMNRLWNWLTRWSIAFETNMTTLSTWSVHFYNFQNIVIYNFIRNNFTLLHTIVFFLSQTYWAFILESLSSEKFILLLSKHWLKVLQELNIFNVDENTCHIWTNWKHNHNFFTTLQAPQKHCSCSKMMETRYISTQTAKMKKNQWMWLQVHPQLSFRTMWSSTWHKNLTHLELPNLKLSIVLIELKINSIYVSSEIWIGRSNQ